MPQYEYRHPETGEVKQVIQGMNDEHSYSEDGIQWKRIFSAPNASIDTRVDPYSGKDFDRATHKKITLGETMDFSKELSEKRADKDGQDPIQKKFFDDYKKNNKVKHFEDRKKKIDIGGISATLD